MFDKKSRELKKLKDAAKKYCLETDATELVLKKTGFSRTKVLKMLRDANEGSLYDYITLLRMLEAKKLIDTTDLEITAISRAVGYTKPKSLRENFVKLFGITPVDYRHRPKTEDHAWKLFKKHPKLTVQRQTYLLDYVKKHYNDPEVSVHVLADRFRLTHQEIELIIKHHTGEDFKTHLLNFRLNQAHGRLPNHLKPIKELALKLGFRDFNYFVVKFENKYGMGPKRFRQLSRL
ncbi:hypothetical protein [Vibrio phage 2 TSL-2019]|uniref:HTH araC/xylS-type domain-containing protein n=1 Tax=Vibrio phage 2 TSL-2019 TaxID=2508172 RepID=A0A513PW52_9CAUD|nr:transcriptional regulator [Vibrio phage 2 TSL-2019]QAU04163.1 hypothetical protein [Vibrio phage 2 TSL-2019]